MGDGKKQEIPSVAFIPQGYRAVIEGNKVIIKKGEGPVSNDLEEAAREWLKPKLDKSYINYGEAKMMELTHFDGYAMLDAAEFGAQWQKQQDQSTIELAEDHAMLAGMEKMKEEMIDKVCKWLAKHWRKYVWLTDNDVIHFGHWKHDFKRAMEE